MSAPPGCNYLEDREVSLTWETLVHREMETVGPSTCWWWCRDGDPRALNPGDEPEQKYCTWSYRSTRVSVSSAS